MRLRRQFSSASFISWIFFALLLNEVDCDANTIFQKISRSSHRDTKVEELKVKGEENQAVLYQTENDPPEAISCNCSDFCPDPNSSELEVI